MEEPGKHTGKDPRKDSQIQPYQVLLFVLAVFVVMIGFMAVYPEKGIRINDDITLRFSTLNDFFEEDTTKVDMRDILAEIEELGIIDTIIPPGGEEVIAPEPEISANEGKKLQYPDGDRSVLYPAFEALSQAASGTSPVRVIHFGDSQIEGDRMTNLIRNELQQKFGGIGSGLQPAIPAVPSFSIKQDHSDNFVRHPGFGTKNPDITHRRFGVTAAFAKYTPFYADSVLDTIPATTGWLSLRQAKAAYGKAQSFNTLKLFYGHNQRAFLLKAFADDAKLSEDSIPPSNGLRTRTWYFDKTPEHVQVFLEGKDSPEIYGFSLEGSNGVQVDNIGLRGQSGTIFGGLDQSIFKGMTDVMNVKLILMQFGGNTVPYIKSEKAAENYGSNFRRQIEYLKRIIPGSVVIVIGPSDMATKVEGKMQTYPYLPAVRDALKKAAFDTGSPYFDIYEVMGGMNSMVGWVENNLAGSDYVHFSPGGAKKIAKTFVASFLEDYEAYQGRIVP